MRGWPLGVQVVRAAKLRVVVRGFPWEADRRGVLVVGGFRREGQ